MNIFLFHKRDLQLVIQQYLSIARITGLSEELRIFSANPTKNASLCRVLANQITNFHAIQYAL